MTWLPATHSLRLDTPARTKHVTNPMGRFRSAISPCPVGFRLKEPVKNKDGNACRHLPLYLDHASRDQPSGWHALNSARAHTRCSPLLLMHIVLRRPHADHVRQHSVTRATEVLRQKVSDVVLTFGVEDHQASSCNFIL